MDLSTYVRIIRKNLIMIIAMLALGLAVGFGVYAITPPMYASSVTFYVSTPLPEGTNAQAAGQFAESRVNSYVELLSSEELGRRVKTETGVPLSGRQIAQRITATSQLNTVLVTATVADPDADQSLTIARGVATVFGRMVDDLDNQGRGGEVVVINVVSGPALLTSPISPDLKLNLAAGLAGGMLLGVVIAVVRTILDTTIRTEAAAEQFGKAPVIGTIPYDAGTDRAPLIVAEAAVSPRAEAFRHLRTNLQFIDAARDAQVLMITSALPGEGKTLTAINLAISFAEFGERVLLIEADMRRPRFSEYLDLSPEVGLSNVLAGQVTIEAVAQEWGDGKLTVLSSGSTPPNPSELLGSTRMAALLVSLREQYDRILVDCAPVLPVTDALVASTAVDAVVLAVRSGRTHTSHLEQAVRSLQAVHAPLAGSALVMHKGDRMDSVRYRGHYGVISRPGFGEPVGEADRSAVGG